MSWWVLRFPLARPEGGWGSLGRRSEIEMLRILLDMFWEFGVCRLTLLSGEEGARTSFSSTKRAGPVKLSFFRNVGKKKNYLCHTSVSSLAGNLFGPYAEAPVERKYRIVGKITFFGKKSGGNSGMVG